MSTVIIKEFCLIQFQQTQKWVVVFADGSQLKTQFNKQPDAFQAALTHLGRGNAEFDLQNISGALFERWEQNPKMWREEPHWGPIAQSPYLSVRSMNALQASGYKFLSQIEHLQREHLTKLPNIGRLCAGEIIKAISLTKAEMERGE